MPSISPVAGGVRKRRTALLAVAFGVTVLSMLTPALLLGCSGPQPTATPAAATPTATPTATPIAASPTATPIAAFPTATSTAAPATRAATVAVAPVAGSECGDWQRAAAATDYPDLAPNDIYRVCGDELHVLVIEAEHNRLAVYPSGD